MLNILVVNENFTGGGLETHIHSYYMELREKHHFVFAFGNYKSQLKFNENDVHVGFHFNCTCSVKNFVDDVERLVQLIRDEKIDVVHAHPFHSIFPAVIAGQLTGVPVVCTHHGAYSFAFPGGVNEAILLYYAYTELVSCVFSVSNTGKLALEERAHVPNAVFMPNAIDSELYHRHTVVNNRRWAAISRLDGDLGKVAALKGFFESMSHLPIEAVDVYGDGSDRQMLEEYVKELGLADRVRFLGFQPNLYERLDGNYNGIIGADRVALEGLTMGYPVLELGYGRMCGILCGELLQQAKDCNFVANALPGLSRDMIAAQLEQVYAQPERFDFRQEIVDAFDIRTIAKAYIKQLSSLVSASHANMITWFEEVKALPNQAENVYASQDVFWTMKRCIEPYAIDRNVKDLFLLGGSHMGLKDEIDQARNSLLEWTQAQVDQTKTQLLELGEAHGQLQTRQLEQAQLLEEARGQFQTQLLEQAQTQIHDLERVREQLQAQLLEQAQTVEQLQARLLEQAQAMEQLREQLEYHRKVLAPLLWVRKILSRIKWKIKSWLSR